MAKPKAKLITLTVAEANALDRAWEVLHYGYVADAHNGYDPAKPNRKRDQRQAEVIGTILDKAGYGEDDAPQ